MAFFRKPVIRFPSIAGKRFLLLGLLLFYSSLSVNTAAGQAPFWQMAGDLIEKGQFAAALDQLQSMAPQHRKDPLILRLIGICLMETGAPDAAVTNLRAALAATPKSISARYFLAQALAYRGSVVEAIETLDEILKMAPQSEYARQAQKILPDLMGLSGSAAAVSDVRRWNIYTKLSGEYDDNVPARPKDSPEDTPTDSLRMAYSFYGEYRFSDQKMDPWPLTLGTGISINGNFHERSTFSVHDLFSYRGSLFLSHSGFWWAKSYEAKVQADFSHTDIDQKDYSNIFGAEASLTNQWGESFLTTISFQYQDKDIENDSYFPEYYSRSGPDYRTSLASLFYLMENRLILGLTYAYHAGDPQGTLYEIASHDITGSATLYLPWSVRVYGSLAFQQEDYPAYTPDPPGRLDDIWTLYFALERPIFRDWLFLEISYSYINSHSELNFSDYNQQVVGLSISYSR